MRLGKLKKVIKTEKRATIYLTDTVEAHERANPYLRWVCAGRGYYAAENELHLNEDVLRSALEFTDAERRDIEIDTGDAAEAELMLHTIPGVIDQYALKDRRDLRLEAGMVFHLAELEDDSWAMLDEALVLPCYRPGAKTNFVSAPHGVAIYADGLLVGVVQPVEVTDNVRDFFRKIAGGLR